MQKRSPKKVFLFQIITLGIYLLYWCAKSKKEVNSLLGRNAVPTLWWFALPFGCFWWAWLYAEALEEATGRKITRDFTFGIWLLATLGLTGGPGFYFGPSFHTDSTYTNSYPIHIHWVAVGIIAVIIYSLIVAVLGIFPTAVQSKINKLDSPLAKNPAKS
jgi:hypothetical protein